MSKVGFAYLLQLQIVLVQHTVQLFDFLSYDSEILAELSSHQCYRSLVGVFN